MLLLSERATFGQASLSSGRGAQNGVASDAHDDDVSMREDGGDSEASGALDVHEEQKN